MRCRITTFVCLNVLTILCIPASGQTIDQYKRQRELLKDHLQLLDRNLEATKLKRASVTEEYLLYERKIKTRERLIQDLNEEVKRLDTLMLRTSSTQNQLEEKIADKEDALKKILRWSFYHRLSQNNFLNLLSSSTFKEAYLKWLYYQQMQNFVQSSIEDINLDIHALGDTIQYLNQLKLDQSLIAGEEVGQIGMLESERNQYNDIIAGLKANEQNIRDEIQKQVKEQQRLNSLIGEIIKIENESVESSLKSLKNVELSANFANRKGLLDWPVSHGVITKRFGTRKHPTLPDVKIENLGIDLACSPGEVVRTVFDGTVLLTTFQVPYKNIVIVNHGEWTTAYYFLDEVIVSKGTQVTSGQEIGKLGRQDDAVFHFEIWQEQKQVDPQDWLIPK